MGSSLHGALVKGSNGDDGWEDNRARQRNSTRRCHDALNAIDTFSLNRNILLDEHPIYSNGRKFAVYRWGVKLEPSIEKGSEKCLNDPESQQNGKLPSRASTVLEEKKDLKQPLKRQFPLSDLR